MDPFICIYLVNFPIKATEIRDRENFERIERSLMSPSRPDTLIVDYSLARP